MEKSLPQLLIVDDDQSFCQIIKDYLSSQGFNIVAVHDGIMMKQYLSTHTVDLIILDVMLPGENGFSLARQLRATNHQQPIIMLSAAGEEVDRVVGLEIGADDYITKPVSLRELLARVRTHLRRFQAVSVSQPVVNPTSYTFGPFTLDTIAHRLTKADSEISITNAEYHLLLVFLTHPNQVLNRDRLMNLISGHDHMPFDRSIDVKISRLRTKIETDPAAPVYIRTIRGEGYLFVPQG
jgi:two-component system phosphate regulon response regulator OmpR